MDYQECLQNNESYLVAYFKQRVWSHFPLLGQDTFETVILQKRALSAHFKTMYQLAIENMTSPEAIQIALDILQDEYKPEDHAILLDRDLQRMGFSSERLAANRPTIQTLEVITGAYVEVTRKAVIDVHFPTFLRTFGELLPGLEYAALVPELERRYGLTAANSEFYVPHMFHDHSDGLQQKGGSHSDAFNEVILGMTISSPHLKTVVFTMQQALSLREKFWQQFKFR